MKVIAIEERWNSAGIREASRNPPPSIAAGRMRRRL